MRSLRDSRGSLVAERVSSGYWNRGRKCKGCERVPAFLQDIVGQCCGSFWPLNSFIGRSDLGLDGRHWRLLGAAVADGTESEAVRKPKLRPVQYCTARRVEALENAKRNDETDDVLL